MRNPTTFILAMLLFTASGCGSHGKSRDAASAPSPNSDGENEDASKSQGKAPLISGPASSIEKKEGPATPEPSSATQERPIFQKPSITYQAVSACDSLMFAMPAIIKLSVIELEAKAMLRFDFETFAKADCQGPISGKSIFDTSYRTMLNGKIDSYLWAISPKAFAYFSRTDAMTDLLNRYEYCGGGWVKDVEKDVSPCFRDWAKRYPNSNGDSLDDITSLNSVDFEAYPLPVIIEGTIDLSRDQQVIRYSEWEVSLRQIPLESFVSAIELPNL